VRRQYRVIAIVGDFAADRRKNGRGNAVIAIHCAKISEVEGQARGERARDARLRMITLRVVDVNATQDDVRASL